jgi:hypothetical protein
METQPNQPPKQEQVQSGTQVAFGIAAFIIGTIVLLVILKYLTGQ